MGQISVNACKYPVPLEYREREVEIYKTAEMAFYLRYPYRRKDSRTCYISHPGKPDSKPGQTSSKRVQSEGIERAAKGTFWLR